MAKRKESQSEPTLITFSSAGIEELVSGKKSGGFFGRIQNQFGVKIHRYDRTPQLFQITGSDEAATKAARNVLLALQRRAEKTISTDTPRNQVRKKQCDKLGLYLTECLKAEQDNLDLAAVNELRGTITRQATTIKRLESQAPNQITIEGDEQQDNKKRIIKCSSSKFRPDNESQAVTYESIVDPNVFFTIVEGSAGGGKSYATIAAAFDLVNAKELSQVVIIRPDLESLHKWGARPGEWEEKTVGHTEALKGNIKKITNKSTDLLIRANTLQLMPYNDGLRGITFDDACIIIDDAQSFNARAIATVIGRMGGKSKVVINGDISGLQDDQTHSGSSGFPHTISAFGHKVEKMPKYQDHLAMIRFRESDSSARHPMLEFANSALAEEPIIEHERRRLDPKIVAMLKEQRENAQIIVKAQDAITRQRHGLG